MRAAWVMILLAASNLLAGCAAGVILAAVGIAAAVDSGGSSGGSSSGTAVDNLEIPTAEVEGPPVESAECNGAPLPGVTCEVEPDPSRLDCPGPDSRGFVSGTVMLRFDLKTDTPSESSMIALSVNGLRQREYGPFEAGDGILIDWDSCAFGREAAQAVNLVLAPSGQGAGRGDSINALVDNRLPPLGCVVHAVESTCSTRSWEYCLFRTSSTNDCQVSADPSVEAENLSLAAFEDDRGRCVGAHLKLGQPCADPTHIGPFKTSWDTKAQFPSVSKDVVPVLRVSSVPGFRDGFHDLQCAAGCLPVDNSPPTVTARLDVTSVPQGIRPGREELVGKVILRYTLVDSGSEPADIVVSARLPNGVTLSTGDSTLSELCGFSSDESDGVPRSEGTSDLSTSPTGEPHVFVWNSDADIDRLGFRPDVGNITIELGIINRCFPESSRRHDGVLNNELVHTVAGVLPSRTRSGDNSIPREQIRFESPASIDIAEIDSDPHIYIADSGTNIIWRSRYAGGDLTRIAGTGTRRGPETIPALGLETAIQVALNEPVDLVALDGDRIFVLERPGFLLEISQGRLKRLLPRNLSTQRLESPLALAPAPDQQFLYIADTENCRIIKFEIATGRTEVVFGLDLDGDGLDMPFDVILPPGRNGCGSSTQDTSCAPNFRRAIGGIAHFQSSDGRKFLFASQTLSERILLIPLDGGPVTDRQLPGGGIALEQDGSCPDVSLLSRPKGLRVLEEDGSSFLYILSDGVRERARGGRGVVVRSRIVEDDGGTPILEPPELVAGTIRNDCGEISDTPCTCTDTNASSFLPEDECGPAMEVPLANPSTVLQDPEGKLLICDRLNQRVRVLANEPGCGLQTFIGGSVEGKSGPGTRLGLEDVELEGCIVPAACDREAESAPSSKLAEPYSVAFLDPFTLLITDGMNGRVRRLDLRTGVITSLAGREKTGEEVSDCIDLAGDGSLAVNALFKLPHGIATIPRYRPRIDNESAFLCDPNRRIFIADNLNHVVRRIDARGVITTYAGSGIPGTRTGDCCPDEARPAFDEKLPAQPLRVFLQRPRALTVDSMGRLFITDCRHRVLMVDPEGEVMTRVAGRGSVLEGMRLPIELCPSTPTASAAPPADRYDPVEDDVGDGGPPAEARLWNPGEMVFDREEKFLYLADWGNNRIRRLTYDLESGTFTEIVTVAGDGRKEMTDDEALIRPCNLRAIDVVLNGPYGLDIDPVTDSLVCTTELGARVYVLRRGENPEDFRIDQISGDLRIGVGGDGDEVTNAGFTSPASVRLDGAGNIYLNDVRNHRVRRFTLPPPCSEDG